MATVLITGANRGLGLELARQYALAGDHVFACCRRPDEAKELAALGAEQEGRVTRIKLDVTDADDVAALAGKLEGEAIDLLIHNAGVYPDKGAAFGSSIATDVWTHAFCVNTIAPLKITEALIGSVCLSERKVVAIVSSLMGSLADNQGGSYYAYRSSKAGANMVGKSLAIDLKPRGVTCVILHPGWVRTDMGGQSAPLGAEESVRGMRAVLEGVTPDDSGRFLRYSGEELPW